MELEVSNLRKRIKAQNFKSYGNTKNNNNKFSNRYNVNLHTIIKKLCLLLATSVVSVPAYAEVGGISATANPIANSSGSVTNQTYRFYNRI